jgi:glucose dehydrogenase
MMRVCFSAAVSAAASVTVSAAVVALLAASGAAQGKRGSERDFSAAKLTPPPTTSWPTNGGNLYNQRFSPLTAINRTNVSQLKGVWRARLRGSGTAPQ